MNSCKKGNPWSVKLLALLIFDIQFTFCRKVSEIFAIFDIISAARILLGCYK